MKETNVLMISRDPSLTKAVQAELSSRRGLRVRVARQVDDVNATNVGDGLGLILLHLDGSVDREQVACLLWISSTLPRPVPVLILRERYEFEEARAMFQMGAADYVSRADHLSKLASLIDLLTTGVTMGLPRHAQPLSRAELKRSKRLTQASK